MAVDILGEDTLKTNEKIIIKHSATMALSPAYTFFIREMANLMDDGYAYKVTSWKDKNCGIVWGEVNDEIVGIFAYNTEDVQSQLMNIMLTAVAKEHRQKGVHTVLNRYYETVAKSLNCKFTCATVNPNNKTRLITAEKDGYKIGYYRMFKSIK